MVSILTSIKKMCGILDDDNSFDEELIIYINTVFGTLTQLGVGPKTGFSINGPFDVWTAFLDSGNLNFELIKSYIYLKVRMMFDLPQNSFLVNALEQQIKELEWRIELNTSLSEV